MGASLVRGLFGIKKDNRDSLSPLDDPPVPPPPDPRLPLNARQLFNITKSWKGISRAMETTGITMFVKLFEENEDILHLFEKFQYKKLHELHRDSMELAQHASIVMGTLSEGISFLNNVDYFMDYLHSVGKLHRKIPGFQRDYFWRIEQPFLAAVQETLGERYTENMENIYKITIHYVLDTVVRGFDLGGVPDDKQDEATPSASLAASQAINSAEDKSVQPQP